MCLHKKCKNYSDKIKINIFIYTKEIDKKKLNLFKRNLCVKDGEKHGTAGRKKGTNIYIFRESKKHNCIGIEKNL